jgi:hypothetical protein
MVSRLVVIIIMNEMRIWCEGFCFFFTISACQKSLVLLSP